MAQKKDSGSVSVQLPADVNVTVEGNKVTVSGQKGSLSRVFESQHASIAKKDNAIVISAKSNKKKDMAVIGTVKAHVRNMIKGVTKGVTYEMKVVYSHFPMSVKVAGNRVSIDNFLGEKSPRYATVLDGVTVKVSGQNIALTGLDVDAVSQSAANIEQASKIKNLDPRVFQDGIYITVKDGKPVK
jgi:large subunit ribosomal protein L6